MKISNGKSFLAVLFGCVLMLGATASTAAICEYIVDNEWNNGFVATIRITNNGGSTINGWQVSWNYTDGSTRSHGWNADVTGSNPYTATPLGWNSSIAPGQSAEFGLVGSKGSTNSPAPTPVVTGAVCGPEDNDPPDDDNGNNDDPPDDNPPDDNSDTGDNGTDLFGITQLYPSTDDSLSWNSQHWSGVNYTLSQRIDPNDPQGISGKRGTGTLTIGGSELAFSGSQPRIYVYPYDNQPWQNVEATVYYKRVADDGTAWGGMVIGMRSGPEGHAAEPCDAHTYYARLRHDGATDFAKELHHSSASATARVSSNTLWPNGNGLPFNQWIGFKFVIYNRADGSVQLETYRDLTGGVDGGDWQLINSVVDNGNWSAQSSCSQHNPVNGTSTMVQTEGGVTFIRNTGVSDARYRWVTIREIDAD